MNADLTLSTLTYGLQFSDKSGSERREVSRGPMLPEVLSIKHQEYVDSATKLPGVRSVVRIDRHIALSNDRIVPVSAYLVVTRPTDANVTSADILAAVERIAQIIQEDDNGLDLASAIFVSLQQ